MTREERTGHWRDVIKQHEESGLSGAAFCRKHGIDLSRFYHWRRRLNQVHPGGFLELRGDPFSSRPAPGPAGVLIHLSDEVCVGRLPDFDSTTLQRAVAVLRDGLGKQPCFP